MIVCKTLQEIKAQMAEIEQQGFEWQQTIFLRRNDEFLPAQPQVDVPCPNCGKFTDREFSKTNQIERRYWWREDCQDCGAVWFVEDVIL